MVERSALFVSCRVGHGANRLAKGDGQMTETAVRLVIEAVQTSGRSMPCALRARAALLYHDFVGEFPVEPI